MRFPFPAVTLLALAAVCCTGACDRNPFDRSQQPRVTVTQASAASAPIFTWDPAGAQLLRVYRGAVAGDGYGPALVWSIAATSQNSLVSPASYGSVPGGATSDVTPQPLQPGETYTVQVTRQDPKGSGDGFTNTGNRYVGTATFTVLR